MENRHIDHIPAAARHGKPWHQLVFWFGANVNVFNVVLGGVLVSIGLTFWWAVAAIVTGTLIGALLIALHATQGPRLGVPQSIQSRGQFGFYGAAFMFPAVLVLNVGFIAAELVIQAQAMTGVTAALPMPGWIIILAVPSAVIGIFGYRWIHRVMQATAVVVGVSLVIMIVQGLGHGALPASQATLARPSAGLFIAGVALLVIDLLSFGPFVSDYTRYLPETTPARKVIGWTFWGGFIGATWPGWLGVIIGSYTTATDPVVALHSVGNVLFSGFGVIVVLGTLPALVGTSGVNSYGAMLCGATIVDGFRRIRPTLSVRLIGVVLAGVVAAVVTIALPSDYLNSFNTFLAILVYLLVPWSAVNLVDFYLVRKGHYSIADIVDPRGRYGQWAWRGLTAYVVGFLAMVPFLSLSFYHGPVTNAIGGADISFEIGLVVAGGLYLWLSRGRGDELPLTPPAAAEARSLT